MIYFENSDILKEALKEADLSIDDRDIVHYYIVGALGVIVPTEDFTAIVKDAIAFATLRKAVSGTANSSPQTESGETK